MQQINNRGFTLIELIVTLLVLTILALIAAPSFAKIYTRQKLESSVRDITMKLSEARMQAITLRNSTGICLSSLSEQACATALSISEAEKNRIFLVQLENGVTAQTNSATNLIFRNNGSIAASANFIVGKNEQSYCINVGITGDTRVTEGTCT